MKTYVKLLLIAIICLFIFSNSYVNAAIKKGDTLGDLKKQLTVLLNKKKESQNKRQKTKDEIAKNKKAMEEAEYELYQAKEQVIEIEEEISISNEKIAKVKEESKELLRLLQKLKSDNVYIEYITGASTMTELIMRIDAVNRLTQYNNQRLDELEMLISSNKKMSKELVKYQETLDTKIIAYEKTIEELDDELAELVEGAVTIDEEISAMRELIKYYDDMGCKDDQDLIACVNIANNKSWVKPVSQGRITSLYGYRLHPTQGVWKKHNGIDIAVSEGTKVYATAAGQVGAIVRKSSCGGNMVYIWTYVNGKPYTYVFMHLLEIKVKVGDTVTIDTLVALSGGGSTASKNGGYDTCTTGAHLHYGLSEGHHFGAANDLALSKFNSYLIEPPGYPGLYQWFYSRY